MLMDVAPLVVSSRKKEQTNSEPVELGNIYLSLLAESPQLLLFSVRSFVFDKPQLPGFCYFSCQTVLTFFSFSFLNFIRLPPAKVLYIYLHLTCLHLHVPGSHHVNIMRFALLVCQWDSKET
ncbi:hypothetical protein ILYODFUR_025783 [Ilyodon furcidens]|uniref:Uncharacterized protein n=1 Tax=Ilyodon furcidens TaxID=33524 RepID=A0ABV0V6U2_9TELE